MDKFSLIFKQILRSGGQQIPSSRPPKWNVWSSGPTYFNCNFIFSESVLNIEAGLVSTETITVKSIYSFFTSKIVEVGLYCKFMQKRMAYFKPNSFPKWDWGEKAEFGEGRAKVEQRSSLANGQFHQHVYCTFCLISLSLNFYLTNIYSRSCAQLFYWSQQECMTNFWAFCYMSKAVCLYEFKSVKAVLNVCEIDLLSWPVI